MNPLKEFDFENKKILLRKVIQVKHISTYAKKLSRVNKDAPIVISGYPGEGKSVLAREIAKIFDKRYSDERNCIYSRKELITKVETYPPSAFILDEAINLLYKRDWGTGAQKELIKVLNICRSKRHLLIFVQPEFVDMDKDIRNGRIRLWIYAIKRGVASVFKPERTIGGGEDPWNIAENNKVVKQFVNSYGQTVGTIEGAYRTKNFLSFLRWNDIPKEEYQVYEEVKDKKKYEDVDSEHLMNKNEVKREIMKGVADVYALLAYQKKIKLGSKGICSAYLQTSDGTFSAYVKRSKIKLGLMERTGKADDEKEAVGLDEDDVVIL